MSFTIEQAVRAQKALRHAAGLEDEVFPLEAFVGMISDEIQQLREQGKSDADIAALIESSSSIRITPADITHHYAPPHQRRPG